MKWVILSMQNRLIFLKRYFFSGLDLVKILFDRYREKT